MITILFSYSHRQEWGKLETFSGNEFAHLLYGCMDEKSLDMCSRNAGKWY